MTRSTLPGRPPRAGRRRIFCLAVATLLLAACGSQPPRPEAGPGASAPRGGGYYQDDGPAERTPADLARIPDAQPRQEPLSRYANNPYTVLGRDYAPMKTLQPYRAHGVASWYGRKFHGQKTSSGEVYDMFAMTAAHTTLPIPSYVRVTNLANGRSVVVRVNDRGPFLHDRLIDLSYAAAWKLDYIQQGSAQVEVETILPGETAPPPAPVAVAAEPEPPPRAMAEAPAALPERLEARGIFLQLGAFGDADNAESLRSRLLGQLEGLGESLRIEMREGLYRLHLGPYPSEADAQRAAQGIAERLSLQPFIIRR